MSRHAEMLALARLMAMLFAASAVAGEDTNPDVLVAKDLTAVIALQGLPCGQVKSASQKGPDEYIASCETGDRYRVLVNTEGRVVVEKVD